MGEYNKAALEDADDAIEYFIDEIVENIIDNQGLEDLDINQYSDSYHHETHVDKSYSLREAAEVLGDLSDYEVDVSGLWQGMEPREAISAMAAYTYGNAVAVMFREEMERVKDAIEDADIAWDPEAEPEGLTEEEQDAWEVMSENWYQKVEKQVRHIVLVTIGKEPPERIPPGKKEWRPE